MIPDKDEDRFTLKKNVLKKERIFISKLIKLCEKYQMVFYAKGIHAPHKNRIYELSLEDMRGLE